MRPLPPLLVALLLVCATGIPVAGLAAQSETSEATATPLPSITTIQNTTNQLTIPSSEVRRTSYNTTGIDIGTATESWSARNRQRLDALSFEERFQRAETNRQRSRIVADRLTAIADQQEALDRRQDRAISQYASGDITAMAFLRTRMLVNIQATQQLETLDRVSRAPNTVPDYSLNESVTDQLRTVEGELRTLTGPMGEQLEVGMTSTDSAPVYVEVSNDGYMLATIDGNEYIRETRLNSARAPGTPDQFYVTARTDDDPETGRLDIADERLAELYPWLYERQRPSFTFYGTSGIYEFTATHPNGRLATYLDGGTTDVFYETQHRQRSSVRTRSVSQNVNGTLQVTLRRSSETGPMRVSASNTETGATVDGRITVSGHHVGSTGSDGVRWTVEPRRGYEVTVATNSSQTTVTVPAA